MTDDIRSRPILDVIDPSYYEPLGEVTVYFATLDFSLSRAITRLLFPGDERKVPLGDMLGSHLPFRKKLDLFSALYRFQVGGETIAELETVCTLIQSIEDRRNQVTHSLWTDGEKPGQVRRLKVVARRAGARFQAEAYSRENLEELREDMARVMPRLEALYLAGEELILAKPVVLSEEE
jgi:hypothetical protein